MIKPRYIDGRRPGDDHIYQEVTSGVYEKYFKIEPGMTVVDVGAHVGFFTSLAWDRLELLYQKHHSSKVTEKQVMYMHEAKKVGATLLEIAKEVGLTKSGVEGAMRSNWKHLKPLMSSDRVDWNTPIEVLEPIYKYLELIDLDPCSNLNSIVQADVKWTEQEDGLGRSWSLKENTKVYVNCPYGKVIKSWVKKCFIESVNGATVLALLPARTDTKWWHEYVTKASSVCLWKGRIKFLGASNSAPFPSAIIIWNGNKELFKEIFSNYGQIL